MLTDNQITMVEAVYLAIDNCQLSEEICQNLVDNMYLYNKECHIYLIWLLNRWFSLRWHRTHLPKRTKHCIDMSKLIKQFQKV